MEAKKVLELYLSKKHPSETYTETEKKYILMYSFQRKNASEILRFLGWTGKVTDYESKKAHVKAVTAELQKIRDRFNNKMRGRSSGLEEKSRQPFGGSFENFLSWWCDEIGADGLRRCCYCGVDEATLRNNVGKGRKIRSKKLAFSGKLQIERMDPEGDYCLENCHFACVICNNAKSDMVSKEDFETYFVPGIQKYWEHIKGKD